MTVLSCCFSLLAPFCCWQRHGLVDRLAHGGGDVLGGGESLRPGVGHRLDNGCASASAGFKGVIAVLALDGALWVNEPFGGAMITAMLAAGRLMEAEAQARARRELGLLGERALRTRNSMLAGGGIRPRAASPWLDVTGSRHPEVNFGETPA